MRATILTGAAVTTLLGVAVGSRVRECSFTWFNGIVVAMAAALVGRLMRRTDITITGCNLLARTATFVAAPATAATAA